MFFLPMIHTIFSCSPSKDVLESTSSSVVEYPSLPSLDDQITMIMNEESIPGVSTCIVKAGEVVWCNGYGYANIETGVFVTPNTPFMLASVSKTITGIALMHLVESEALGLDDPINDYLSFDVQHPTDETNITLRMLLSHTSGIDDNWSAMNSVIVDGDSPIPLADFMEGYLTPQGEWYDVQQNFLGGVQEESHYSNIGVALAAFLVEPISGVSFSEYCERNIFSPLDMSDTSWFLSDLRIEDIAVPYLNSDAGWEAVEHYGYPDYPDGALRTGAEPLAKFLSMFSNGGIYRDVSLLSEESISEMKRTQYPQLDDTQGLIWYSWEHDGSVYFGHGGSDMGVSTQIGIRDDGIGYVILMNAHGEGSPLERIKNVLLEQAETL